MSKTMRWVVALAAVAALVVLFVVLRPSGEPEPAPSSPTSTPSPSPTTTTTTEPAGPTPTPTVSPTETPSTPDAIEVEIEVEGDRIDVQRDGEDIAGNTVRVTQGEDVVITVKTDHADEVHLHGYDVMADVAPGSPATIELTADVAGIFECELEGSGTLLFELEVRP